MVTLWHLKVWNYAIPKRLLGGSRSVRESSLEGTCCTPKNFTPHCAKAIPKHQVRERSDTRGGLQGSGCRRSKRRCLMRSRNRYPATARVRGGFRFGESACRRGCKGSTARSASAREYPASNDGPGRQRGIQLQKKPFHRCEASSIKSARFHCVCSSWQKSREVKRRRARRTPPCGSSHRG